MLKRLKEILFQKNKNMKFIFLQAFINTASEIYRKIQEGIIVPSPENGIKSGREGNAEGGAFPRPNPNPSGKSGCC